MSAFQKYQDKPGYESFKPLIETLNGPATATRPPTAKWQQIVDTVLVPMLQKAVAGGDSTSSAGRRQDQDPGPPQVRLRGRHNPCGTTSNAVPAAAPTAEENPVRIPDRRFALYLMAPAALFLAVFVAYPLFRLVTDSFFKISPIAGGPRDFVGLDNYVRAFTSPEFMGAGWRTLAYTLDGGDPRVRSRPRHGPAVHGPRPEIRRSGGPCSCTR